MITLADAVRGWATLTPDAPAWWIEIDSQLKPISWSEVHRIMTRAALSLRQRGMGVGDRLVSQIPNGLSWALLDLACGFRGIIHVPLDRNATEARRAHVIERTRGNFLDSIASLLDGNEPKGVLSDDAVIDRWLRRAEAAGPLRDTRSVVSPDAPATILFTSGTTGQPSGVVLSHANLIANARGKLDAVPQLPSDRRLNILPFAHAYARTCELSTWALSGSSILCAASYDDLLVLAPRFQPTLLNGVPYLFDKLKRCIEADNESIDRYASLAHWLGGSLRTLASGGAGLANDVFQFFSELGLPIIQGYGLTEAGPVVCSNRSNDPRIDCVGPPIIDTEIRIDDDERLHVRGPGVMLGYWENDAETDRCIEQGWLATGDRAELRSDGSLRILGRADDRIVLSTGHKVDPELIERRIVATQCVRNCMLVGDHQRYLIAIVVADSQREAEIAAAIRSALTDLPFFAIPQCLLFETSDWTESNGLLNGKGGLRRAAIFERFRHAIAAVYCRSVGRKQVALDPRDRDEKDGDRQQHGNEVQQ